MKCPHCNATMETNREFRDFACPICGLAGPRDTLQSIATKLSPTSVLTEAERVMRDLGVTDFHFMGNGRVSVYAPHVDAFAATLAAAIAELARMKSHG